MRIFEWKQERTNSGKNGEEKYFFLLASSTPMGQALWRENFGKTMAFADGIRQFHNSSLPIVNS
jgi:hypothetical protein